MYLPLRIVGICLTAMLLTSCSLPVGILSQESTRTPFQPNADGLAAAAQSRVEMTNLSIAYAANGGGDVIGPGSAQFIGPVLVSFSDNALPNRNLRLLDVYESSDLGGRTAYGTDGLVSWGIWVGNAGIDGSAHEVGGRISGRDQPGAIVSRASGGLQYVIGAKTPILPTSGTVRYQTLPTKGAISIGPNPQIPPTRSELSVNFGGANTGIGIRSIFGSPEYLGGGFELLTTGGVDNPALSEVHLRRGSATFGGNHITVYTSGAGGISPILEGSVEGFFAGTNAERVGMIFGVSISGRTYFSGMDVLGQVPAAAGGGGSGGGGSGGGGSGGGSSSAFTAPLDTSAPPLAMVYAGPSTFTNTTVGITPVTQDSSTGLVTAYTPAETVTINTAQGADMGGDALITWGRWVNGTPRSSGTGGGAYDLGAIGAEQGFHYVIGKPSPSLPASGTANFTLLGATKPTFGDGALPAGTLTSAAMAVAWGGAATSVGIDMTVTMPSDGTYRVLTTGGTATPGTSEISTTFGDARFQGSSIPVTTTGGARACAGGTCEAKVEGLFTGANGARAGLVYTVNRGLFGQPTSIVGAAAFSKQ